MIRDIPMAKAGSVDYSRRGGFCCSCNCMSCYGKFGGCDYNNEVYVVKEDRIIFGEEPGPGACCLLSSIFFPVTYLLMLILSAVKSLNGLVFVAQDGGVTCTIYCKKACYEEEVITLDNVVDLDICKRLNSVVRQTKSGFVTTHFVLVSLSIKYRDHNGELQVHTTPELIRTVDTYEEEYYHAFRDDIRKFIRQNSPVETHETTAAAESAVHDGYTGALSCSPIGYELTPT